MDCYALGFLDFCTPFEALLSTDESTRLIVFLGFDAVIARAFDSDSCTNKKIGNSDDVALMLSLDPSSSSSDSVVIDSVRRILASIIKISQSLLRA